jgi:excisionase family DNA binding protein
MSAAPAYTLPLSHIAKASGPKHCTLKWRLTHGKYPAATRLANNEWRIPRPLAVQIVAEELLIKDMIPLPTAALAVGLGKLSLNPKAQTGIINAHHSNGHWYITPQELQRLKDYYTNTITTTQAATQLHLAHRRCVHNLIQSGRLPALRLGAEYRVRPQDIKDYLDKVQSPKEHTLCAS